MKTSRLPRPWKTCLPAFHEAPRSVLRGIEDHALSPLDFFPSRKRRDIPRLKAIKNIAATAGTCKNILMKPAACVMSMLLALFWGARVASAVWEYAPLCPDTRLAAPEDATWEFGVIYSQNTLFPGDIVYPAGAKLVIFFSNLDPLPVKFEIPELKLNILIPPGSFRRIVLPPSGLQTYRYTLEILGKRACYDTDENTIVQGKIQAGLWPNPDIVYRAATVRWNGQWLPSQNQLPSGRHCEFYLASPKKISALEIDGQSVSLEPKTVVLVELIHPKGGKIEFLSGPKLPKASLKIR